MAKIRLSKCSFVEHGYGQVEENHLSARRTGRIYAQLPAAASIDLLENGQFVKYNYKDKVVDFSGQGEWMLVNNEVKIYELRDQTDDFAMIKDNYGVSAVDYAGNKVSTSAFGVYDAAGNAAPANTSMVPRVFGTQVGDLYTTNTINEESVEVGDILKVNAADGYLSKTGDSDMEWQVVKVYTMPDLQKGAKLQRVQ